MRRTTWLIVFLFCLGSICGQTLATATPAKPVSHASAHILFISPSYPDDFFWHLVEQHMRYAATALGFELKALYANGSPLRVSALASEAIANQDRADFLVLQFNGPIMPGLLAQAQQHQVKVITFNTQQSVGSRQEIAQPRERYPNWLAHLWPNDKLAGQLEAEALLLTARQRWPSETPTILAFNGAKNQVSQVASERSFGLHQAINHDEKSRLAQEFSGYWNVEKATRPLLSALQRHPNARLLWSASDAMGLRLREQLIEGGWRPEEFLIASIDATPQGIDAVERGELVATIGGHFMEGAWCMVLIYDYLHQHDFANEAVVFNTEMQTFDRNSIATLRQLYAKEAFAHLDYRAFTRTANSANRYADGDKWTGYNFSWQYLLSVLKRQGLLPTEDPK